MIVLSGSVPGWIYSWITIVIVIANQNPHWALGIMTSHSPVTTQKNDVGKIWKKYCTIESHISWRAAYNPVTLHQVAFNIHKSGWIIIIHQPGQFRYFGDHFPLHRNIPSGNLLHSYWKSPFRVDFPIENGGSFHSFLYVYQRVPDPSRCLARQCQARTSVTGSKALICRSLHSSCEAKK